MKRFSLAILATIIMVFFTACFSSVETVDFNKVVVSDFAESRQYTFSFVGGEHRFSLSDDGKKCLLVLNTPVELKTETEMLGRGTQYMYYVGTCVVGEETNIYQCSYDKGYSNVIWEEDADIEAYKECIKQGMESGLIQKAAYDRSCALLDGKTIKLQSDEVRQDLSVKIDNAGNAQPLFAVFYQGDMQQRTIEYTGSSYKETCYKSDGWLDIMEYGLDGNIRKQQEYQDGGLLLREIQFYENGEEKNCARYDDAGQIEEYEEYYPDTHTRKLYRSYVDGVIKGESGYTIQGEVTYDSEYSEGKIINRWVYEDGQVIAESFDHKERVIDRSWLDENGACRKIEVIFPDYNKVYTYEATIEGSSISRVYSGWAGSDEISGAGAIYEGLDVLDHSHLALQFEADGTVTAGGEYYPSGVIKRYFEQCDEVVDNELQIVGWAEHLFNEYGECTKINLYNTDRRRTNYRERLNEGYSLSYMYIRNEEYPSLLGIIWYESKRNADGRNIEVLLYNTERDLLLHEICEPGYYLEVLSGSVNKNVLNVSIRRSMEKSSDYDWMVFEIVDNRLKRKKIDSNQWIQYYYAGDVEYSYKCPDGYRIGSIIPQKVNGHKEYLVSLMREDDGIYFNVHFDADWNPCQVITTDSNKTEHYYLLDIDRNVLFEHICSEDAVYTDVSWELGKVGETGRSYYVEERDEDNCKLRSFIYNT